VGKKINMSIPYWRLSGFYFFHFATRGGFAAYWSLYLEHKGLNPAEIGTLFALLVGSKIIASNLWSWIADHTGKNLQIIRVALFFSIFLFSCFLLVHSYYGFFWITISFSIFWNAAMQFEPITFFHLKSEAHRYSQIRLWGSLGFIMAVLGLGSLLDFQPITILPVIIAATLVGTWCMSLITPEIHLSQAKTTPFSLKKFLVIPGVLAFFTVSTLLQAAQSPYATFYSIYLIMNHYSVTLAGLLWSLGVFAEIIFFIYAGKFLKRYSLRNILLFSVGLSIVRWLLIAHWTHLGILVIAQLLHAASFGGTHIAATYFVRHYFGETHHGKGRALHISISSGLGGTLGSFCSGYYWESLGAAFVFSMGAILCAIALLIAYRWVGVECA
jgi:PPP family 3-phenylpropionic acid transporter